MSDSESESGSASEVDPESALEKLAIEDLQGRWLHSGGDYFNVRGSSVKFDLGGEYTVVEVDNTVELDGARANVAKSTTQKIIWEKGEESMSWRFESELQETEDGSVQPDLDVDTSNIITGKRRRREVNYVMANKELEEKEGKDDDEDDFDAQREKAKKKLLSSAPKSSITSSSSSSSSASSSSSQRPSSSSSVPTPTAKKLKPAPVEELPPPKKLSLDELNSIRDQLGVEGLLKPAEVVAPLIKQLERHPMELGELKSTKIGVALNRYRKHTHAGVNARVTKLVTSWKSLMGS